MPCLTDAEVQEMLNNESCSILGGYKSAYMIHSSDLDLVASAALWSDADFSLSNLVLAGANRFKKLGPERKTATLVSNKAAGSSFYETILTAIFDGKSALRDKAICDYTNLCYLVAVVFDNNCEGRILGLDFSPGAVDGSIVLELPVTGLKLDTDSDDYQTLESKPIDTLTFKTETLKRPLQHSITEADFITNFVD